MGTATNRILGGQPLGSIEEPVHRQVLDAARRLWNEGRALFTLAEIVEALPNLNRGTVRTHVSSRCCVNAPDNHQHRWPYFHRVRRGVYRLRGPFIAPAGPANDSLPNRRPLPSRGRPEKRPGLPTEASR